jgi:hypothetical protein
MLQNSTDAAADLKEGPVWGEKGTNAFGVADARGRKRLVAILIGDGADRVDLG